MFGKKKKDGAKAEKPAKDKKAKKAKKPKAAKSTEGQSRFGDGGLKTVVVENIEKVLMVAVAAAALFIAFKSYSRPGLEDRYAPERLGQEISTARSHMETSTWSQTSAERLTAPDNYSTQASADVSVISPSMYALSQPLQPIHFDEPKKRDDVTLIALRDLEVTTGFAVAMVPPKIEVRTTPGIEDEEERTRIDPEETKGIRPIPEEVTKRLRKFLPPAEGAKLRETNYACIMGLMPLKDQFAKYKETYADANGYSMERDFPRYVAKFQVERAELGPNGKQSEWTLIFGGDADKRNQTEKILRKLTDEYCFRGIRVEEVARNDAIDPLTIAPLPSFIYRDMSSFKHSTIETQKDMEQLLLATELVEETSEEAGDGMDRLASGEAADGGGGGYGGGYGGGGGGYGGGYGGGDGGYGGGGGGYGGGYGGGGGSGDVPLDEMGNYAASIDNKMFRFFDFTVRPGRSYRYRVRLALSDPNYPDPKTRPPSPKHLSNEVTSRIKDQIASGGKEQYWRFADWSTPSPIASVGRSERLLAGTAKAPTPGRLSVNGKQVTYPRGSSGPTIESIVIGFDPENKVDIPGKVDTLKRGSLANFLGKKVELIDPKLNVLRTKDKHVFRSDILVLDIAGGEELKGRKTDKGLRTPGEMLVFTSGGQLEVHSEMEEASDYRFNDYPEDPNARRRDDDDDRRGRGRGNRGGGAYGGAY